LLAAGSGRRFGAPKALVDTGDGPWVLRALHTLDGLPQRLVVVGAAADRVVALLPDGVVAVVNPEHDSGMGSSLAVGLRALGPEVDAAVVMLVDLPDVPAAAVQRVVGTVTGRAPARTALVRAGYGGTPGHPVLIGAEHVPGVLAAATGDRGARDYLSRHTVTVVDCSDLAGGADMDEPPAR
jgi:CTP:molybdopterin cytidylyltransferase MocA